MTMLSPLINSFPNILLSFTVPPCPPPLLAAAALCLCLLLQALGSSPPLATVLNGQYSSCTSPNTCTHTHTHTHTHIQHMSQAQYMGWLLQLLMI